MNASFGSPFSAESKPICSKHYSFCSIFEVYKMKRFSTFPNVIIQQHVAPTCWHLAEFCKMLLHMNCRLISQILQNLRPLVTFDETGLNLEKGGVKSWKFANDLK